MSAHGEPFAPRGASHVGLGHAPHQEGLETSSCARGADTSRWIRVEAFSAPVLSTYARKPRSSARCGPTHRLQWLPQLNACHTRPVNAHPEGVGGMLSAVPIEAGLSVRVR